MSWLRLTHSTVYEYARPVRLGPHRLVVRPREGHDLRVDSFALRTEPPGAVEWCRDIFGNSVALVEFEVETPRLAIVSEAVLWRTLANPSPRPPEAEDWPVVYDPLETAVAEAYRAPVYPGDRAAVQAWLEAGSEPQPTSATQALDRLCQRIRREITYARREEKGVFTPAQTLALRTGSCRDLAALFLEAGRALGLAMRFVSGYLECVASRAGQATTHAWVEGYVPDLGWRGYDATSGQPTTASHIVAGVSNHPRGVMPVSGLYWGEAVKTLGLTVNVRTEELERAAPEGF